MSHKIIKVLLIDANPIYEHKNEGKLIKEFLNILEVKSKYRRAKNKTSLLRILENAKQPFIHISAHGEQGAICTSHGKVTAEEILNLKETRKANGLRKAKLVISSACQTGSSELSDAFLESLCRKYLAPKRDTYWIDTAFLSAFFYYAIFKKHYTLDGAIDSAFRKWYIRGVWLIYP